METGRLIEKMQTIIASGALVMLSVLPVMTGEPPAGAPAEVGLIVTATSIQAQEIEKQLKAGTDFAVLAKEQSIDASAAHGGYLGRLQRSQLLPQLQNALKGLRVGDFSEPVRIPSGFAVLTILRTAPRTQDLDAERIKSLATQGAVRDTIDISGMAAADAAFRAYRKPEGWGRNLSQGCAIRTESYAAAVKRIEQQLPAAETQPAGQIAPLSLLQGHAVLALLAVYTGEMDKSISEWKKAYGIATESVPGSLPYVEEAMGVTYLHWAEMENGVYRAPGDQGFFPPLRAAARLERPANARLAIQYFTKALERQPDDLEVKWLLNLAYVTVGGYPSEVPSRYLISQSHFESKEQSGKAGGDSIGRFQDVAPAAGLNVLSGAGGVVVEDFDNDGLPDVVTSSMDMCEPLHFMHNDGNGKFSDRTVEAGLAEQLGGLNLIQGDYNNDGCMDLLVLRGGWELPQKKSLLRNNCHGGFTDVTEASGLGKTLTSTQTAVWADVDNDGYLDLFVGNENAPSQLFRNRGDGTFEDISHAAGIDRTASSKGVTAADYDQDGLVDFYVSNVNGANFLYHNDGNGRFTEIGRQAGVQAPYFSFATWFFDYDNDGWPDLFVNCYYSSMEEVMRSYLALPVSTETLKLYRNLHNGTFQDVTAEAGLDKVLMPMGANFGDVDNDGYLDMYLGVGQPSLAALMPHVLLRNKEGKRFVDITAPTGTGELHKGHGIAFADLEHGGQEDILAGLGGAVPSDKHTMRVFENPGNGNDWINVRLTGSKSNRAGVGAEIKVTVDNSGRTRSIYRTVGATSSFGGNPMEQHIGLGAKAQITALEVWWPASGTRQHFTGVGKDQYIAIKEFANGYTKLNRAPYQLGGGATTASR